jgi:hypothetical protein
MALPDGVHIITEDQRDNFDTYIIPGGQIYCFAFSLEDSKYIQFSIVHTRLESQDYSLRCWFSDKPMGFSYFNLPDNMDWFAIPRKTRKINVGAIGTNTLYQMPAGQTNYLMVQNMQNSDNFFEIIFDVKS